MPLQVLNACTKVKQTYRSAMPEKTPPDVSLGGVFVVAAILVVQILYPLDRALPLARMNGRWVGWQSETDLANQATLVFQRSKVKFIIGGKPSGVYTLSKLVLISRLKRWQVDWRTIPLAAFSAVSIFWQLPNVANARSSFRAADIRGFAQKLVRQLSRPPINAGVAFKDGQLTAVNDVPGHLVSRESYQKRAANNRVFICWHNGASN